MMSASTDLLLCKKLYFRILMFSNSYNYDYCSNNYGMRICQYLGGCGLVRTLHGQYGGCLPDGRRAQSTSCR